MSIFTNYDLIFSIANKFALLGWIALLFYPKIPVLAQRIAATFIPVALAVAYTVIIAAHFGDGEGDFNSLSGVMQLFTNPAVVLAGWMHYLAYDLFVGAWIVRQGSKEGIHYLLVVICLPLALMFGPAGYLLFQLMRLIKSRLSPGGSGA